MAQNIDNSKVPPIDSVSSSEFRANCARILDTVAADGREVIIERRGTPIAKIVPATHGRVGLRGLLVGLVDIPSDIDIDALETVDGDWLEAFLTRWDEELGTGAARGDDSSSSNTA